MVNVGFIKVVINADGERSAENKIMFEQVASAYCSPDRFHWVEWQQGASCHQLVGYVAIPMLVTACPTERSRAAAASRGVTRVTRRRAPPNVNASLICILPKEQQLLKFF
ncbi:jg23571 [Pararge aegeria aegeria]|uniref:Jg23571 protein n=1 Tax=Pararge aegeria aegeria TaxID=348720 RepID=A0A8S4RXH9_9NEOP|nr:jg23571 [Pararge aegeria aegeria]